MRIHTLLAVAAALLVAGCVPPDNQKFSCTTNADCLDGFGCAAGACVAVAHLCDGVSCGHGTCAVKDCAAACGCETGYTGAKCDACAAGYQDADGDGVCAPDCQTAALACAHGSCTTASGAATCACETGYAGALCDACADGYQDHDSDGTCSADCGTAALDCHHGACSDASGTAQCACDAEYQGDSCSECATGAQDFDGDGVCTADCSTAGLECGHGACDDASGTAACACTGGYTGATCATCGDGLQDHDGDGTCTATCATAGLSCGHGACDDASGIAACACTGGYTGATCATCGDGLQDHDGDGTCTATCATAGLSCGHGACDDASGTAACACDAHYAGSDCSVCDASSVLLAGTCRPRTLILGGPNGAESTVALAEDENGFYLAGNVAGTSTPLFGAESPVDPNGEGFVAAYGSDAKPRWAMRVTGSNRKAFAKVVRDAQGNLYAFGYTYPQTLQFDGANDLAVGEDCLLLSLTNDGAYRWARHFNGYDCTSVTIDAAGNAFVVGSTTSADFGGGTINSVGGRDAFLASYDQNGNYRWAKLIGGTASSTGSPDDAFNDVATDAAGNVYVIGYVSSAADFGNGVKLDPKTSTALTAMVAASYTSDGGYRWARIWPQAVATDPNAHSSGLGIAVDRTGVVALFGNFWDDYDFGGGDIRQDSAFDSQGGAVLVTVRQADGSFTHQRGLLAGTPITARQLVFDGHDQLHVVGNINNGGADLGGGRTGEGAFRATYNNDLSWVASSTSSSGAYPTAWGVSVRDDGSELVVGQSQTGIDWGYGSAPAAGNNDTWLTWFPAP